MKFSVSTVLFPELTDHEEIVKHAAGAGYDGIEWRVQTDYHLHPDRVEAEAPRLAELCEANGLEVVCLASYLPWDDVERIKSVLRGAAVLKCPRIRLAGFNYDGAQNYWQLYDKACKQIEALQPVLREANVKGVIETHFGTIHASAHGAYNVVRHFDPNVVGCILDGSNLVVEGWEVWPMVLSVLDDYLDHVHVRNAAWLQKPDGKWHWTWAPLDQGMADWGEVLRLLQKRGYDGYISNENILGVPTSSKGYIGEAHSSLGGYDQSRTIQQRLADVEFLKSLIS